MVESRIRGGKVHPSFLCNLGGLGRNRVSCIRVVSECWRFNAMSATRAISMAKVNFDLKEAAKVDLEFSHLIA